MHKLNLVKSVEALNKVNQEMVSERIFLSLPWVQKPAVYEV